MQIKNISRNAVLKRLNRHLQRVDGERLHTARGEEDAREFGQHYTTDVLGNIAARHVQPVQWARELGLLRSDETVSG